MERVVVLGASNKEDRYSYKAIKLLKEYGHSVIPVHPVVKEILGIEVMPNLNNIREKVDTLTLYVNPKVSEGSLADIIALNPSRVIMNPGTESELVREKLEETGIKVITGCTLVMLKTDQY